MEDFLKTHYLDYFCIIPSRDTQITVRAISSSNLIASLVETHQLFKIKKTASTKKYMLYTNAKALFKEYKRK